MADETDYWYDLSMRIILTPMQRAAKFGFGKAIIKRAKASGGVLVTMLVLGSLSACQNSLESVGNVSQKPIPSSLIHKMKARGMKTSSPILLRIFKSENVIEIWKEKTNGRYALLEKYEICKWSGKLGPKFKEGDRQAPEGFYDVNRHQMNPNSSYHLSFNIGYPNTFDRSHKRTGTHLMVHGACSSAGCYSMTDERVEEIYALAREAFKGGQKKFQVQAYPFRLTPKNMATNVSHPQFEFWKMLKEGYDHFEITKQPVKVDVCEKRYMFNRLSVAEAKFSSSATCPKVTMRSGLLAAYTQRRTAHEELFSKVLNQKKIGAKRKGEELNLTSSKMTLVAKGYEILPPATPKPVVVPEVKPVNEDALVSEVPKPASAKSVLLKNEEQAKNGIEPISQELQKTDVRADETVTQAETAASDRSENAVNVTAVPEEFRKLPDVQLIPVPVPPTRPL